LSRIWRVGVPMPIVQPSSDKVDVFEIVLDAAATPEQRALKDRFDAVRLTLISKRDQPEYKTLLERLQIAARLGFDGVSGNPPQRDVALISLGAIKADYDRLGNLVGRFQVRLPGEDPARDDSKSDQRDIIFEKMSGPVPADQLKFKAEVEDTLTTLQVIFQEKKIWKIGQSGKTPYQRQFEEYRGKLRTLAQVGLAGDADPNAGSQALKTLQSEILRREGPRIKNAYMKVLGTWAVAFGVLTAVAYLVARNNSSFSLLLSSFRNTFLVWTGTMIGTWLSFGLRRPILAFDDLGALESDMVEPAVRLVFTGLIAITIALIFHSGMVHVSVGGLSSANLFAQGSTALLIGILLGVSEQALPGTLTRRAAQFVSEVGGKI
jgi:hypothetical protein